MPKSFVVWLITQIAVDQAPKKRSRCQHRQSAVARRACDKVLPSEFSWLKGSGKDEDGLIAAVSMEN